MPEITFLRVSGACSYPLAQAASNSPDLVRAAPNGLARDGEAISKWIIPAEPVMKVMIRISRKTNVTLRAEVPHRMEDSPVWELSIE